MEIYVEIEIGTEIKLKRHGSVCSGCSGSLIYTTNHSQNLVV